MRPVKIDNKSAAIVLLAYLCISFIFFAFVLDGEFIYENDTPGYINNARHFLAERFFSNDGISAELNRTPGYPLFLALIYGLGGGNSTVVVVQILISAIGIYLFYRTLILMGTPVKTAVLGAAFLLLNITTYEYTFRLLTESLFGFCLMFSVYFLARFYYKEKHFLSFVLFAIALNYALLIRPILIYFNMLLSIYFLVLFLLKKIKFRYFAVFAVFFISVFFGWSYRNYRHSSVFLYSTIQNHNLKNYNSTLLTADIENISEEEARAYHDEQFLTEYPNEMTAGLNSAEFSLLEGKYGSAYIKAHFAEYIKLNIKGLFKMMLRPGVRNYLDRLTSNTAVSQLLFLSIVGYLFLTYFFYLSGFVINRNQINIIQIFIFFLCGYQAAAGAALGISRFRAPFFPLLLLSAVSWFPAVRDWETALKQKIFRKN
jgi:4-amino-4-deoxy-L-arabinose transferase-like glycosyltransferase